MKKKLIATVMAATMAVTALTGCGSSSASSAKKDIKVPTKPFGDTVKYDPSVEINDGKDISIDMWEWGSDELFQKIIDRYTAIHPNVTIRIRLVQRILARTAQTALDRDSRQWLFSGDIITIHLRPHGAI